MNIDSWIDTLWKVLAILSPLIAFMLIDVVAYAIYGED